MTEGKISIKIDENGELFIETHGILGPSCIDEITKIMDEIALITEVNKTDEYHMRQSVSQSVKGKQVVKR